ncbi:dihydrofolate reductase [Ignatzschineria sp. LJL83]
MTAAKISLILAMADNGTIGHNNALPWHLPNDLKFFKQSTLGKPIVMGRKTYDSIGRPLPGRENIVISRSLQRNDIEGCLVFPSLQEAFSYINEELKAPEIMIMGGAQIYKEALPFMDRLYLTHVHADVKGDTQMPAFDFQNARLAFEEKHEKDEKNRYDYTFEIWDF